MILVLSAVAALVCGCGKTVPVSQTTEPETTAQAVSVPAQNEDDVALPQDNVGGSTTAAVVSPAAAGTTSAFQQSAIMQALATAPQTPVTTEPPTETTTAPAGDETPSEAPSEANDPAAATTTTKPEETTKAATAELLHSSVLKHINSGNYTETISAFGKDKSSDDKLSKIVRGGQTAYYLTIPAAGLTFKVFPSGGKYYLATTGKYCELTKAQYDGICKTFGNAFPNFSALQYKKTETVREGLRKYTREDFTLGSTPLSLWYSGGALFKMEMDTGEGTQSLPITVTGAADAGYFNLAEGLEKVDYAAVESLVQLSELFFGA